MQASGATTRVASSLVVGHTLNENLAPSRA